MQGVTTSQAQLFARVRDSDTIQNVKFRSDSWFNFGLIALIPVLIFTISGIPFRQKIPFDKELVRQIEHLNPDYIVLGNSMVESRINSKLLSSLTNSNVLLMTNGGIQSAVWYLLVKNMIVESNVTPKYVFIFFRGNIFSMPRERTEANYRQYVEAYSTENESTFNTTIKNDLGFPVEQIRHYLTSTLDLQPYRSQSQNFIQALAYQFAATGSTYISHRQMMGELFHYSNYRSIEATKTDHNFDKPFRPEDGFMPAIIDEADAGDIKMVFVRIQERPTKHNLEKNERMRDYIGDLEKYVTTRGHVFYDFTGDTKLPVKMYGEGDHIADAYRDQYTRHFYSKLKERLKL